MVISMERVINAQAGWVTPGQMTALMGVSGAGKVLTSTHKVLRC